ncbi:MAG: hypothetical protein H6737_16655 [Alphaproteobacteria bacterium]|nr:hypothetical protein [Alphaproteobacteria bacterium]
MLRLTLRAREDARFLARIIERDGFAFVLDYGDSSMVADASERIARGFSLWRGGKLETVSPSSPDLLPLLAEFYAQEGLLVSLEEPALTERPEPLENALKEESRLDATITEFREAPDFAETEETELVSLSDIPDIGDALEPMSQEELDEEDEEERKKRTNPGAIARREMWRPPGSPTPKPPPPRKKPKPVPDPSATPNPVSMRADAPGMTLPPMPAPRLDGDPDPYDPDEIATLTPNPPSEHADTVPPRPPERDPADLPTFEPVPLHDTPEDEEETELVSPEMRARAMAMEEGMTELHSGESDLSATLSEIDALERKKKKS